MRKNVIILLVVVLLAMAGALYGVSDVGVSRSYRVRSIGDSGIQSEPEWEPGSEFEPEALPEESAGERELDPVEFTLPDTEAPGQEQGEQPEEEEGESEAGESPEDEREESEPTDGEGEPPPKLLEFVTLSPHEALVYNYGELKSALAGDNGITTVYFGGNITMQGGIKINPQKADILIVGLNPLDPGRTQPYTLTDVNSADLYQTVYVNEAGTETIHIRDINLVGKNFYGPFCVADIADLKGFVMTYERVTYDGPQLCHNRRGTAHFVDVSARIHGENGTLSLHQEFSEAKHLVFEGVNSIESLSSDYSIFWHPLGGSFTIADDSSLTISSPNTSLIFGVFYADGYLNKVDISVGSRSVLDMTISGVVAPEVYVTLSSFTVHEGGAFHLTTTQNAPAAVLRMGGPLVVDKEAAFTVDGAGGTSYPVLRQQGGDITVEQDGTFRIVAASPYTALLNLVGCGFLCHDPASVVLYNGKRDITALTTAGRVYVSAQQVNYWNETVPGGLDFPPLYGWRKADHSNLTIDGTLPIGSAANFSKISTNYAAGDPPGSPPNQTTFNMVNARVLSFGRLTLDAVSATTSGVVRGVTAPGALVRASFTQQGVEHTLPDRIAGADGGFAIPTGAPLEAGTVVTVKSGWQYLTAEVVITVEEKGSLALYVPDVLEFYTTPLSPFPQEVKRLDPDWKIVVSDGRETGGGWSVYARLEQPIHPPLPQLPVLENALIFVDDAGTAWALSADADTLIQEHVPAAGGEVVPIVWDSERGLLFDMRPGSVLAGTAYTATIHWTLVDGV